MGSRQETRASPAVPHVPGPAGNGHPGCPPGDQLSFLRRQESHLGPKHLLDLNAGEGFHIKQTNKQKHPLWPQPPAPNCLITWKACGCLFSAGALVGQGVHWHTSERTGDLKRHHRRICAPAEPSPACHVARFVFKVRPPVCLGLDGRSK